jgi:hypothetical protein
MADSGSRYFRRPFFAVEVAFDFANLIGTVSYGYSIFGPASGLNRNCFSTSVLNTCFPHTGHPCSVSALTSFLFSPMVFHADSIIYPPNRKSPRLPRRQRRTAKRSRVW